MVALVCLEREYRPLMKIYSLIGQGTIGEGQIVGLRGIDGTVHVGRVSTMTRCSCVHWDLGQGDLK